MGKLPTIKIVSNKKDGTKVFQDGQEIKLVVAYELFQDDPTKMPIIRLDILAPEVEAILEECEREDRTVNVEVAKKEPTVF